MKKTTLLLLTLILSASLSAQCYDDQHSTNWYDAWVACSPSQSPNPARGNSFWIQYDFGAQYVLGQTHFWNINDPAHRDYGLRNIIIDYSTDGVTWQEWGTHMLFQGTGQPNYEGVAGPDLEDLNARFILITAEDNWGGSCYGFSELRIDLGNPFIGITNLATDCLEIAVFPNPIINSAALVVASDCPGSASFTIRNMLGNIVASGDLGNIDGKTKVALPVEGLSPGVYAVSVFQLSSEATKQIVVL